MRSHRLSKHRSIHSMVAIAALLLIVGSDFFTPIYAEERAATDADRVVLETESAKAEAGLKLTEIVKKGDSAAAGSLEEQVVKPLPPPRPSWGKQILWYVPNRVMDLLDIFRLRVRAGPGLSVSFRMTDYATLYFGKYNTIYAGLPGPRYPYLLRSPVGRESLKGIIISGVDATDDTRFGPQYGASEVDIGVNLFIVGVEAGVDPVEIGDFLGGLFFFDFRGDDYPRKSQPVPEFTSGLSIGAGTGMFKVEDKPAKFDTFDHRMGYLHTNVQLRISEPVRSTDMWFAEDQESMIVPPQTTMRAGTYFIFTQARGLNFQFKPDIQLDVHLPNVKRKLKIFVETARNDNLPGTYESSQDTEGVNVGARKTFKKLHLSLDAGVRARWLPEVFTRLIWSYEWTVGEWTIRPDERIFADSDEDEGLGAMSSLYLNRWFGESELYLSSQTASGKWTTEEDTLSWTYNIDFARVPKLLDEKRRGKGFIWEDAALAQGLRYNVFGSYGNVDQHRASLGFRGPLYRKWIYWEIDPGLQWRREDEYETQFILRTGIDLLFWGASHN